jgi:hypothetical protein
MDFWHSASAIVCIITAIPLAGIVLHPKINEGLIIKAGLVAMVLSLLATASLTIIDSMNWSAYWRAGFTLRAGLAVVCVGVLLKYATVKKKPETRTAEQTTKYWIARMVEPVDDMAHLFKEDEKV